jgi:ribosome-associated protein
MKGDNVVLFDLRKLTIVSDFFVICGSPSTVGVKSIAEEIIYSFKDEGLTPDHIEGLSEGAWVLIDYGDLIVHVFHEQIREYFDLESLWGDALQRDFRPKPRKTAKKKSKK